MNAAIEPSNTMPDSAPTGSHAHSFAELVKARVARTVVGQEEVVERVLIALLTGGHLLLEGMPGLAKTLLVNSVARAVDLKFGRVQFTIDLLPSDILGTEILDQASGSFRTHEGPIFTNLLLADEINRAAPRVQSALLEAMQERRVTIGNVSRSLPTPFLVIATQNPVEQSGTFELPEAQLDRFMMCHRLRYPTATEETAILQSTLALKLKQEHGAAVPKTLFDTISESGPVAGLAELREAMGKVQEVHVSDVFVEHVVRLVQSTREDKRLAFGVSPRAGLSLVQAARARAFLHRREYVVPEDLVALSEDVLRHRMRVSYAAAAQGIGTAQVVQELVSRL